MRRRVGLLGAEVLLWLLWLWPSAGAGHSGSYGLPPSLCNKGLTVPKGGALLLLLAAPC